MEKLRTEFRSQSLRILDTSTQHSRNSSNLPQISLQHKVQGLQKELRDLKNTTEFIIYEAMHNTIEPNGENLASLLEKLKAMKEGHRREIRCLKENGT